MLSWEVIIPGDLCLFGKRVFPSPVVISSCKRANFMTLMLPVFVYDQLRTNFIFGCRFMHRLLSVFGVVTEIVMYLSQFY